MITKFKLFEKLYNIDALFGSVLLNKINNIKEYINNGGDINLTFETGENMLMVAARNGYTNFVKYLIEEGIDLNMIDYLNRTTIILLCSVNLISNSKEIVKLIIDADADINITDINNQTALYHAALKNEMELVDLLIDTDWTILNNQNKSFYDVLSDLNQKYIRNQYPEKYYEYMKKINIKKFKI